MDRNIYKGKMNNNKRIKLISGILLVIAVMTIIISSNTNDSNSAALTDRKNNSIPVTKYYSSMTVKDKNTLWELSELYKGENESHNEYIDTIMKMNNLSDTTIHNGMNIIYYYYGTI